MKRSLRLAAAACALALLPSCARIMYPERVGNKAGTLDTIPLVVDIVLFIPGIIPGVIALVVDFASGAIYVGGGQPTKLSEVSALGTGSPTDELQLRLLDEHDRVLGQTTLRRDQLGSQPVALPVDPSRAPSDVDALSLRIEVQVGDGPARTIPLRPELAAR